MLTKQKWMDKVCDRKKIVSLCDRWHAQKKKIVFTNGCFDLLHQGHLTYLCEARSLGDVLIVGLNTDVSVQGLKGSGRPIFSQQDRACFLAALAWVDRVVLFHEQTPLSLIEAVRPDVLVKGGDYQPAEIVGADCVIRNGGRVVCLSFVKGYSTTNVITKITKIAKIAKTRSR